MTDAYKLIVNNVNAAIACHAHRRGYYANLGRAAESTSVSVNLDVSLSFAVACVDPLLIWTGYSGVVEPRSAP